VSRKYERAQLDELAPAACPCGQTRRAFLDVAGAPATVHLVDIAADARRHYHKRLTEIYLVLDGVGRMELDGEEVPVRPMTAVLIRPLCRHRAVGRLRILNIVVPGFDPDDEWFD